MIKGIYKKGIEINEDVYLRLEDNRFNDFIILGAVNNVGKKFDSGNLLEINRKTGVVRLCGGVNPKLGITLNHAGRVEVTTYSGYALK